MLARVGLCDFVPLGLGHIVSVNTFHCVISVIVVIIDIARITHIGVISRIVGIVQ